MARAGMIELAKSILRSKYFLWRILPGTLVGLFLILILILFGNSKIYSFGCKYFEDCTDEEAMEVLYKHVSKCSEVLKEPQSVDRRNKVWQIDEDGSREMALYTAHLDSRDEYGDFPAVVRVLGVGVHQESDIVYCHLWYDNITRPVTTVAMVKEIGRGLKVKKRFHIEYLYTCPLYVANFLPRYISLQFEACLEVTNIIPISIPTNWAPSMLPRRYKEQESESKPKKKRPTFQHEFGVCVPVTFGELNPYILVEWFEFHRLLGVTQFTMYTVDTVGSGMRALEYYSRHDVLRLRKVTPPVNDFSFWSRKLATISILNRCLYENMYNYRYLIIVDLDEVIVPNKTRSYKEMISSMLGKEKSDPPSWIFQNAYFWLDIEPKSKDLQHLRMLRFLKQAETLKAGVSAKSIVNPRKCVVINNHHCLIRTYDVDDYYWTNAVSPKNALLHHYKLCHLGKRECKKSLESTYENRAALKFKDKLKKNAEDVLVELGIWAY